MKTKLLLSFSLLVFSIFISTAQIPQGFNYQAIARDNSGTPIPNSEIQAKVSILSDTTGFYLNGSGDYLWEELHTVTTNDFGLFNLVIGTKSRINGSAPSFDSINWSIGPLFVGIKIQYSTHPWENMGTAILNSVPYAMVADKANGINAGTMLSVTSNDDFGTEALFEVKRKDGQTVFAVYPDAVNVYVPRSVPKGRKGGFAIGGFDGSKLEPQDYFRVTPDSVRIYIDPAPAESKGSKGGFAIGGYSGTKGINSMYFNLTGAPNVNTVVESPQILWYPNKKAFLAGSIHIGREDSVGLNSTALGYKSIAMGNYSQAFGYMAKAFGDYSTSIGKNSIAGSKTTPLAENAFAFGNAAKATGNDSYAFGSGAEATGLRSFAFGSVGINDSQVPTSTPTKASGNYSAAIGMGATASNTGSMALGVVSVASGIASTTLGYYSYAFKNYSTAIGFKAVANGEYSVAIGSYSAVGLNANYASAFGRSATANGVSSVAVGYGATSGGLESSAFGRSASAGGASSMALGINANASATNSIAIGNNAVAGGASSTSLGSNTTTSADALYSTALGYGSSTTGQYATALGYNAQAIGNRSISIGAYYDYSYMKLVYNPVTRKYEVILVPITKYNTATDDYSIALGNGNTSTKGGLAIGSNNYARAMGAVAIGHTNYADSAYSLAAGANNYARGYNSFAMGESIIAEAANSFVVGYNNYASATYNREEWVLTDPLFVIGNGGSGTRSNAMVVAKNGNTMINGNLYVTGSIASYSGTGDNLGNHIASQAIKTNGYYLNYDNDPGEGIYINSLSNTYIYGSLSTSSTFTAAGRSEITNSTDATGTTGTGSLEIANSLRLDGDEIITNTGTTLLINNDNNSNVQVDGGTLFIDATNNRIGLNNLTPAYGLDVSGTMRVTSTGRFGGDVTLESISPAFYFTDTELNHDDFKFEANTDLLTVSTQGKTPVTVLQMASSGAVSMPSLRTGTGLALYINSSSGEIAKATSSIRYKNHVNSLQDISWLYDLRPVSFLYNEDQSNSLQYGFIAEEVEKINNSLVVYDKDGNPDGVLYNNLISTLVKATQDQKKTIETIKADNDELKQRIEKLEAIILSISQVQK
jgi:hypothetical protein